MGHCFLTCYIIAEYGVNFCKGYPVTSDSATNHKPWEVHTVEIFWSVNYLTLSSKCSLFCFLKFWKCLAAKGIICSVLLSQDRIISTPIHLVLLSLKTSNEADYVTHSRASLSLSQTDFKYIGRGFLKVRMLIWCCKAGSIHFSSKRNYLTLQFQKYNCLH